MEYPRLTVIRLRTAQPLVSNPVLIVKMTNFVIMVSLREKPVRERWSRTIKVNAMATSLAAPRMLIEREILKIWGSWSKDSNCTL